MTISLFLAANDIHGMIFQVVCRISEQTSPMGDETVGGRSTGFERLLVEFKPRQVTSYWVLGNKHGAQWALDRMR